MRTLVDSTAKERLLAKVRVENDCWIWTATLSRLGYGMLRIGGKYGNVIEAHQVSYAIFVGTVPEGKELDHLCRNRACVNPYHLEPVTHHENMLRGFNATKTACVHGHDYTSENTYINTSGRRECRVCLRNRRKRAKAIH